MSGNVELRTYYGIETPRETFWTREGETIVCAADLNHPLVEGASFCHACGNKVKKIAIEHPSPRFTEICEKSRIAPDKFFEQLTTDAPDQGWEWEDDGDGGTGQSFRLHWLGVEAFVTVFSDEATIVPALGFRLDSLGDRGHPRVSAFTWRELEIYDRAVRDVAKIFGAEGEPKLYAQVYYG